MELLGIHHLTAVSANIRDNHRFYTRTLGMRLVKRSVNQDDVSAYHLFYADRKGTPGSDLTFFDWPVPPERRGTRSIARTALRVDGLEALEWWAANLKEQGVRAAEIEERDGRLSLDLEDPEGQRLTLVDDAGSGEAFPWEASPVPPAHQIRGLGPIPAYGTKGAAMGTCIASAAVSIYSLYKLWKGSWVVAFPRHHGYAPDWTIIRSLFRFGLPTGIQGIAMNIGGVLMLSFIGSLEQSAAAQAAFAVSYSQLFSLITWTSVGLMGAAAAVAGQNLGAGNPDRSAQAVHVAARYGLTGAALIGSLFLFFPAPLLAIFGMRSGAVVDLGVQLLRVLSVSGLFIAVALTYTGGLQGTGDTKSPLYISIISQVVVPLGICFGIKRLGHLDPIDIWIAILLGHVTRCALSILRFNQGKWRSIRVDIGGERA